MVAQTNEHTSRWYSVPTLGLAAVVFVCTLSYWAGNRARDEVKPPALMVDTRHLQLGEIWESSAHRCILLVRNTGNESVHINGFTSSCGCVAIQPSTLTIPPGETVQLGVTLNLARPVGSVAPLAASRPVAIQIVPLLGDRQLAGLHWTLTALVRPSLAINPRSVSFPGECVRGRLPATQRVKVHASVPLDSLEPVYDPDELHVKVLPGLDRSQQEFILEVEPAMATIPAGFQRKTLILKGSNSALRLDVRFEVPVTAYVIEPVQAVPQEILLGAAPIGAWKTATVSLATRSGDSVVLDGVDHDREQTEITPLAVDTPSPRAFLVRQLIGKAGDQHASIRFLVRRGDGAQFAVAVPVHYYGITTPVKAEEAP